MNLIEFLTDGHPYYSRLERAAFIDIKPFVYYGWSILICKA